MIASVEVLQAKKAVTDAQREVMAAEKDMQLAQTALYGVMGIAEQPLTALTTELFEEHRYSRSNTTNSKLKSTILL